MQSWVLQLLLLLHGGEPGGRGDRWGVDGWGWGGGLLSLVVARGVGGGGWGAGRDRPVRQWRQCGGGRPGEVLWAGWGGGEGVTALADSSSCRQFHEGVRRQQFTFCTGGDARLSLYMGGSGRLWICCRSRW